MLIETFPQEMSKVWEDAVNLTACMRLSSCSHKEEVFRVRTLTTLLVFSPCWLLFTVTSRVHVMNNAGPVLELKLALS